MKQLRNLIKTFRQVWPALLATTTFVLTSAWTADALKDSGPYAFQT